ncbi:hypothetical protein HNY73_006221 [Argiope bruennichi]|uniref:Uncharacterized protein n=1 Tax=Argiope bruennichi TaxID=94029 RepID=A0A8T0FJA2_ARGBR|nr:hypothetical protein HNY73_006221 [Argiope bruennichi]
MTSKSKILKAIQNFSNVCKEIERIEERIKNAVENANSSDALFNVLKTKMNTYEQKLENSLSNLDVNDSEEKLEKYLKIQDVLFECAVLLENTKPKNKTESLAVSSNTKIQASKKLPKLELPHLYGDMENWISFKELFQATVINNSELFKIDKLQYLFASTKGNAAKLIRGFAIREENLKNSWELLCEIFENKNEKRYDPCEQLYQQSVCRKDEGRFIVSLPFKENKTLEESKERAIHLFYALENRLNQKPPLKEKFHKFINEYLSLGHMKAISIDKEKESPNCYIPYHMIQNDNSSTTKCRVVFNASAKTSIILKIMLQELWKSKAAWDDPVPLTILETWTKYKQQSYNLNLISVPRLLGVDDNSDIQLQVSDWYHIPGKLNPGDCATRGLFADPLKDASYWWNGPDWIKQDFHPFVPSLEVLTKNLDEPDSLPEPTSVYADRNNLNDVLLEFSFYTNL